MVIYGLKNCDKCRDSLKYLKLKGYNVSFVDIRQSPIDATLLVNWLEIIGSELFNRRSTTWRGLDLDEQNKDILDLLTSHPTLIKRPVIVADSGEVTVGWNKAMMKNFEVK